MILRTLLKSRCGGRPSGLSIMMTVVMSEFNTMNMSHAWSQRGVSYSVSACGSTEIYEETHLANLEDDLGDSTCKKINSPSIFQLLHIVSPITHEHNRMRQVVLGLERK